METLLTEEKGAVKKGRKEGGGKWERTLREMEIQHPLRVTIYERNYIYRVIRKLKAEGFSFRTRLCLKDGNYANIIRLK